MLEPEDRLFAEITLEHGFCTSAEIDEAAGEIATLRAQGKQVRFGQVLLRLRFLTAEQFVTVSKEIARRPTSETQLSGAERSAPDFDRAHAFSVSFEESNDQLLAIRETPTHLGPYEIVAPLGRGGMGTVFRARHQDLGHEVAIKVMEVDGGRDHPAVKRFLREGRAIAGLNHPNFVRVHDWREDDGLYYFVMELVEGVALDEHVREGPLPVDRALDLVEQISRALHHAHECGILHRDLKPANIVIDRDGTPRIVDFGLAKIVDEGRPSLTPTGAPLGTPHYMSPEQCRGDKRHMDRRCDVYSLGVVLYECLSARRPFEADSIFGLLQKIQFESPPSLDSIGIDVGRGIETIIERAMARRPEDRYPDAHSMAEAIARLRR